MRLTIDGRTLILTCDNQKRAEVEKLDGCYVLKTTLSKSQMQADQVHSIYKNLSKVETAFRTIKTGLLEIRPLYHRKATRTRGCAVIAMLAYKVTRAIESRCKELKIPLDSIFDALETIQATELKLGSNPPILILPTHLTIQQSAILNALNLTLPKTLSPPSSRWHDLMSH